MKGYRWFYTGIFSVGGLLGFLTSASSSPVVATVLPLIFALVSAGGALYIVAGGSRESPVALDLVRERAEFLGKQFLFFSIGFGMGIWPGAAIKFHASSVWFLDTNSKPAYSEIEPSDIRLLAAVITLDDRMKASGLGFESRRRILEDVNQKIVERGTDSGLGYRDEQAVAGVLEFFSGSDASSTLSRPPAPFPVPVLPPAPPGHSSDP